MQNNNNKNNSNNRFIYALPYLVVALFITIMMFQHPFSTALVDFDYNEFMTVLDEEKIEEASVIVNYNTIKVEGSFTDSEGRKRPFETIIPNTEEVSKFVLARLKNAKQVEISDANSSNLMVQVLGSVLPLVIFGAFGFYMVSKMGGAAGGANNKAFDFSRSKARLETEVKVRFDDVAGCD